MFRRFDHGVAVKLTYTRRRIADKIEELERLRKVSSMFFNVRGIGWFIFDPSRTMKQNRVNCSTKERP